MDCQKAYDILSAIAQINGDEEQLVLNPFSDSYFDKQNNYSGSNNFTILNQYGENIGNMPAEICNALAPVYDAGKIEIAESKVSFVEHITERSRYAKQAILFIELKMLLK